MNLNALRERIAKKIRRGLWLKKKNILIVDPNTISWTGLSIINLADDLCDLGISAFYFHPEIMDDRFEIRTTVGTNRLDSRLSEYARHNSAVESFYICSKLTCIPSEIDPTSEDVIDLRYQFQREFESHTTRMRESITKNNIRLLLAFQGYNLPSSAARRLSLELGIPLVVVENTFSNKHIIAEPFSGCAVNRTIASNILWRYSDILSSCPSRKYAETFRKAIFQNKYHDHASPETPFLREKVKQRIVFMGQVHNDSSSIFGLHPQMISQVEIILGLIKFCVENDLELVVKLHPKESHGRDFNGTPFNYPTWQRIIRRNPSANENPLVTIDMDNAFSSESILNSADLVVTINSQSGIEAALLGKRVILCGSSFFDRAGFTTSVYSFDGLYSEIRQQIGGRLSEIEETAVNQFVYCYFNLFCIKKTTIDLSKCIRHYLDNRFLPFRPTHF